MDPAANAAPHWLNPARLRAYPRLMLAILLLIAIGWLGASRHLVDPRGKPIGCDFITYYAASRMAISGHAAQAYDIARIAAVEHAVIPGSPDVFAFYYPPTFYALILPLARVPYLAALALFLALTLAAYVFVLRRIVRGREAMLCLAAFSGLWMNLLQGQNGFLTAALAGAAMLTLEDQPVLAGVFIGLLSIKPHLLLLFPAALIAARAWKTLASAAVTTAAFLGLSTALLGTDTLPACAASLSTARSFIESGALPWGKMPSLFAALRVLHVPVAAAYALHAIAALAATVAVWRVWRTTTDTGLRGAALMTATFLVSPYLFDYDMAWLAFPIAWIALAGARNGFRRGEREVLAALWITPLLLEPLSSFLHINPAPWLLLSLLWFTVKRATASQGEGGTAAQIVRADVHALANA